MKPLSTGDMIDEKEIEFHRSKGNGVAVRRFRYDLNVYVLMNATRVIVQATGPQTEGLGASRGRRQKEWDRRRGRGVADYASAIEGCEEQKRGAVLPLPGL